MDLSQTLRQAAAEFPFSLDAGQQDKLLRLLAGLMKWNRAYNLTAIRDERNALILHLLDSLSLVPFLGEGALLDVGTGPGFPALPLAIARPELAITALDANNKKIRFVRQMVHELELANVEPVQQRIESFSGRFPQITSRAFADLGQFVPLTRPLLAPGGVWLAMKAQAAPQELVALGSGYEAEILPLQVPLLAAERCLVRIRVQ